jgi:hypothetical protein
MSASKGKTELRQEYIDYGLTDSPRPVKRLFKLPAENPAQTSADIEGPYFSVSVAGQQQSGQEWVFKDPVEDQPQTTTDTEASRSYEDAAAQQQQVFQEHKAKCGSRMYLEYSPAGSPRSQTPDVDPAIKLDRDWWMAYCKKQQESMEARSTPWHPPM